MLIYPVHNRLVDSTPKNYIGPHIVLRKVYIGQYKEIQEIQLPHSVKFSQRINGKLIWTKYALIINTYYKPKQEPTAYAG